MQTTAVRRPVFLEELSDIYVGYEMTSPLGSRRLTFGEFAMMHDHDGPETLYESLRRSSNRYRDAGAAFSGRTGVFMALEYAFLRECVDNSMNILRETYLRDYEAETASSKN